MLSTAYRSSWPLPDLRRPLLRLDRRLQSLTGLGEGAQLGAACRETPHSLPRGGTGEEEERQKEQKKTDTALVTVAASRPLQALAQRR